MIIVHICLTGPYTDEWNYQENLITKYQVQNGHQVKIIASEWEWGNNNKIQKCKRSHYVNNDKVEVIRLKMKKDQDIFYRNKRFIGLYDALDKMRPDIIFVHNIQFFDIKKIAEYAKHNNVVVYVDNHADFSNSARTSVARIYYKIVWGYYAKCIEPYTRKFYGVLPARVDFLKDIYGLPEEKCELLVMGADDFEVERSANKENINRIRKELRVSENEFIIMTGGKIDIYKRQTLDLMKAMKNIQLNQRNIKLFVFGSVAPEIKDQFDALCDGITIKYLGWADSRQAYDYFAISDLVIFPGRHSVYWEQVVGQGKPMICKYWQGTTHVDLGGNVLFIKEDSVDEIRKLLENILNNEQLYCEMRSVAEEKGISAFSYQYISKKAIEENEGD